jgi:hypothetical protein
VSSSASATDCEPTSSLTLRNADSTDMPDSTQIKSRSSASGKARFIESWRRWILFFRNKFGLCIPK